MVQFVTYEGLNGPFVNKRPLLGKGPILGKGPWLVKAPDISGGAESPVCIHEIEAADEATQPRHRVQLVSSRLLGRRPLLGPVLSLSHASAADLRTCANTDIIALTNSELVVSSMMAIARRYVVSKEKRSKVKQ